MHTHTHTDYYTSPATGGGANVTAWPVASKDDDNEHLVDRFEDFMNASLAESKPFLAVIWFHSVHIPCNDLDAWPDRSCLMTHLPSLKPMCHVGCIWDTGPLALHSTMLA